MIFELKDCGGCRTCAMACSFRLTGEFNVNHAAIRIIERSDRMGFDVEFVDDPNDPYRCDGCVDFEIPYCVQFCHLKDELQKLINLFLESDDNKKEII